MNPIEKFITCGLYKPTTQKRHKYALNIFFKKIKKDANTYFEKEQDYQEDMLTYLKYLKDINSHSIKIKLNTIKIFIEYHENRKTQPNIYKINRLQELYKQLAKQQPKRAVMKEKPLDKQLIKKILSFAKPNAKALFMISTTSGMRISEILQLTQKDINLKDSPSKIEIPAHYTKTNQDRITFITDETKQAIKTWSTEKEYLTKKKRYKKYQNSDKIFPFKYGIANEMWINLITKAKLNQKHPITKRYVYHIHLLRKYFRRQLTNARIEPDIAETLIGHENIYVPLSDTELEKYYKQAIPNLLIFEEEPTDLTGLEYIINQVQQENEFLHASVEILMRLTKPIADGKDINKLTAYDALEQMAKGLELPPETQKLLKAIKERQNKSKKQ